MGAPRRQWRKWRSGWANRSSCGAGTRPVGSLMFVAWLPQRHARKMRAAARTADGADALLAQPSRGAKADLVERGATFSRVGSSWPPSSRRVRHRAEASRDVPGHASHCSGLLAGEDSPAQVVVRLLTGEIAFSVSSNTERCLELFLDYPELNSGRANFRIPRGSITSPPTLRCRISWVMGVTPPAPCPSRRGP